MTETQCTCSPAGDVALIEAACLDYVAGYFSADAVRIERGVNTALCKRTLRDGGLQELSRESLIKIALQRVRPQPEIAVEIHDIFGDIATARITSTFVDYVQLARLDGRWQVINVLWLNIPEVK